MVTALAHACHHMLAVREKPGGFPVRFEVHRILQSERALVKNIILHTRQHGDCMHRVTLPALSIRRMLKHENVSKLMLQVTNLHREIKQRLGFYLFSPVLSSLVLVAILDDAVLNTGRRRNNSKRFLLLDDYIVSDGRLSRSPSHFLCQTIYPERDPPFAPSEQSWAQRTLRRWRLLDCESSPNDTSLQQLKHS